jgi:hypothetical protein
MSKLTYADSRKFESLLADIFPSIKVEDIAYDDLVKAIKETLHEMKLQDIEK